MQESRQAHDGGSGAPADQPYVGLRPYTEADKLLFYGRDRDARLLLNKIFSSPLILYAPSGAGKTSLLQTLVGPKLRDNGAAVAYFESWEATDPAAALAREIANLAPEPTSKPVDLVEAVTHAGGPEHKPVVVILDQFEQFLLRHQGALDPLRRELGRLIRGPRNCHVVISLREEFLAGLDPFSQHILNLWRSTFRLDYLDRTAAAAAIERPAALFGASYAPKLLEELLNDLAVTNPAGISGVAGVSPQGGGGIDVVLLQIYCKRLWAEREGDVLELDLYKRLQGEEGGGILKTYVEDVVAPWDQAQRRDAARILDFLAPRSQVKIPYPLKELMIRTGLDRRRVGPILDHLAQSSVVRVRDIGTVCLHELYHDAFIQVLRPWIDEILEDIREAERRQRERAQRRVRRKWWLALGLTGALGVAGLVLIWQQKISHDHQIALSKAREAAEKEFKKFEMTRGQIDLIRKEKVPVETGLDSAASYLWNKGEWRHMDDLWRTLTMDDEVLARYPVAGPQMGQAMPQVPASRDWPLTVRLSPDLRLDPGQLQRYWRAMSKQYLTVRGIPLPRLVKLELEKTMGPEYVEIQYQVPAPLSHSDALKGHERAQLRLTNALSRIDEALIPGSVLVSAQELPSLLAYYVNNYQKEWSRLDIPEFGGDHWLAPRWAAPMWKAAGKGDDVHPLEAAVVMRILKRIVDEPRIALTPGAVALWLSELRDTHGLEATVEQLLESRGGLDRVRTDLLALLDEGVNWLDLVWYLEELAQFSRHVPSAEAVRNAVDVRKRIDPLSEPLRGVSAAPSDRPTSDQLPEPELFVRFFGSRGKSVAEPYAESRGLLRSREQPIRVYLGTAVAEEVAPGSDLDSDPGLLRRLADLRGRLYLRFGAKLADVRFKLDEKLETDQMRVEVLGEREGRTEFQRAVSVPPGEGQEILERELLWRLVVLRGTLLDAERVAAIERRLPETLRRWLAGRFAASDLRRLLQAMIAPDDNELQGYVDADAGDAVKIPWNRIPESHTLRGPEWLLRSLVFWLAGEEAAPDGRRLVSELRSMQRERLAPTEAGSFADETAEAVRAGIEVMMDGRLDEAEEQFSRVRAQDPEGARLSFRHFYSDYTGFKGERLAEYCKLPEVADASYTGYDLEFARYEIEKLLEAQVGELPQEDRRALRLCLLRDYLATGRMLESERLLDDILREPHLVAEWQPRQVFLLAYWMLEMEGFRWSPPERFETAAELLRSAFRNGDEELIEDAGDSLLVLYRESLLALPDWYLTLLVSLADLRPEVLALQFLIGAQLVNAAGIDRARDSLRLLERLQPTLADLEDAERSRLQAWVDWNLGLAYRNVGENSPRGARKVASEKAVDMLRRSLGAIPEDEQEREHWPPAESLYFDLSLALLLTGDLDGVEHLLKQAETKVPSPAEGLVMSRITLELAAGRADRAAAAADELVQKAGEGERKDNLYVKALTYLAAARKDYEPVTAKFLDTTHPYRDTLRLVLRWRLLRDGREARARQVMEERRGTLDLMNWEERASQREPYVWYDMLIGYFLGLEQVSDLFDWIDSPEAFADSPLSRIGYSLDQLRCEAWFYEALWQSHSGDKATRRERFVEGLQKVLSTDYPLYDEYSLARILLNEVSVPEPMVE